MNTLSKIWNCSLRCKSRIHNNLSLRSLNPSSFSPFPICDFLAGWGGYGAFTGAFQWLATSCKAGPSQNQRRGLTTSQTKPLAEADCSRRIFRLQQAVLLNPDCHHNP